MTSPKTKKKYILEGAELLQISLQNPILAFGVGGARRSCRFNIQYPAQKNLYLTVTEEEPIQEKLSILLKKLTRQSSPTKASQTKMGAQHKSWMSNNLIRQYL